MAITKRIRVRVLLLGGMAVILLSVLSCQWIARIEQRKVAEAWERTRKLIQEVQVNRAPRAALGAEQTSGNAWDDYGAALSIAQSTDRTVWTELHLYISRSFRADRAAVQKIVKAWDRAIVALHAGAGRKSAVFPCVGEDGLWQNPSYPGPKELLHLIAARARILREEGGSAEATALLLDGIRFCIDVLQQGSALPWYYSLDTDSLLAEFKEILEEKRLTTHEIKKTLEGLQALEVDLGAELQGARQYVALHSTNALRGKPGDLAATTKGFSSEWRYCFSQKLLIADAILQLEPLASGAEKVARRALDYPQECPHFLETPSPNPIVRQIGPHLHKIARSHSGFLRVRVRLLLAAAHYGATGQLLDLADPYGDRLHHSRTDTGLRIWSNGPDERDDGGVSDFSGILKPGTTGRDLVIEIPAFRE